MHWKGCFSPQMARGTHTRPPTELHAHMQSKGWSLPAPVDHGCQSSLVACSDSAAVSWVQEAMALGVKVLVIPLGADQPCNAAEIERAGSGLQLDQALLESAKGDVMGPLLRRLLSEPSFQVQSPHLCPLQCASVLLMHCTQWNSMSDVASRPQHLTLRLHLTRYGGRAAAMHSMPAHASAWQTEANIAAGIRAHAAQSRPAALQVPFPAMHLTAGRLPAGGS